MEWIKVYNLAEDEQYIRSVQKVSLETEGGLEPDPALLGSGEWWNAVEHGELGTQWVTGTIKRPMWTGMNDFPEVEIDESGQVSSWVRFGDVSQYSRGRGIRIGWVWQKFKDGRDMKVVLEVWLEAGAWRPTSAHGPGPGRSLDEGWEGGPA